MDKFELREAMKERRKKLPESQALEISSVIKRNLFSMHDFKKAVSVAFYVSIKSEREVFTEEMITDAIKQGKRVCIPKVSGDYISMFLIHSLDDLSPGYKGILEPKGGKLEIPDLVVVPGIAFDRAGNRIGFGRGYYDRLLSLLSRTTTIGLAFSFQVADKIIPGRFDIPMDFVVTENEIIDCRKQRRS